MKVKKITHKISKLVASGYQDQALLFSENNIIVGKNLDAIFFFLIYIHII